MCFLLFNLKMHNFNFQYIAVISCFKLFKRLSIPLNIFKKIISNNIHNLFMEKVEVWMCEFKDYQIL